ncbi:hypothetical protein MKJ03_03645 (plasmid) [Rhizobium sp. SSM4.3]|uniref:Uncharacterized protein n=2 Tax=Peteryoungia algae TaxID=2919917 RepID=A0ABT0CW81_9HYPH|nr:hypothetical protein [Rhizobium sp. SSM4.3]MCJ8237406.1 hypothetical protein [Rhizobium sp. SSM4.3]
MKVYIGKLAPDADVNARSQDVIKIVRSLVSMVLFEKGFDGDQIKDKMASMIDEK